MTEAPDVAALARVGVAVIIGTRDSGLRPAVSRGWGPVLSEDGARLEVCVDAPEGSPTRADLLARSPVAVTLSRLTTYATVQLKGAVASVAAPDAASLAAVRAHREAFTAETGALGVPAAVIARTMGDELLHVAIDVAERYDGTPGPGAGRAL